MCFAFVSLFTIPSAFFLLASIARCRIPNRYQFKSRVHLRSIKCQNQKICPANFASFENWKLVLSLLFSFIDWFNQSFFDLCATGNGHRTPQSGHNFIKLQIFMRINKYLSSDHSNRLNYSVGSQLCASTSNVAASQTYTKHFADFSSASSPSSCILEPVFRTRLTSRNNTSNNNWSEQRRSQFPIILIEYWFLHHFKLIDISDVA